MSQLLAFSNFLKESGYAADDLEKYKELIEPIQGDGGWMGYRVRAIGPTDRITQRCNVLLFYAWSCRDYVKKILIEHGVSGNIGEIVNAYIKATPAIQVVSYLANAYKHAGADASQKWAVEIAPHLDKPFALGQLMDFPLTMKPTVMRWGDNIGEFEFTGHASVGDDDFKFTGFKWTVDCTVIDKDGKSLGTAAALAETTFSTWLTALADHGITI